MARRCDITGAQPAKGTRILRSGKAKKKGGIGMHVTANTPREFVPNLKTKRVFVPELKRTVKVKATARAIKTLSRRGPMKVLKSAGLV
jgi:large subunit ribosomal protein L28